MHCINIVRCMIGILRLHYYHEVSKKRIIIIINSNNYRYGDCNKSFKVHLQKQASHAYTLVSGLIPVILPLGYFFSFLNLLLSFISYSVF